MSRSAIWTIVVALVLGTLATLWFLDNFERVPQKTREGMKKEALRNPYLAAERLFERLGRKPARVASPAGLDALPDGGVLILEGGRQRTVSRARAERLLGWVERGGYLIVEAESAGDDFLLQRFGVTPFKPPQGKETDGAVPSRAKSGEIHSEVILPGSDVRYRVAARGRGLSAGGVSPAWRVAGPYGDVALHYAHGRGNVTAVNRLNFLDNRGLGALDHAELGWALLQRYQPGGTLHLAVRLDHPTLWQWLADSAWMALTSAAALLGLWLWSVVPRFGGMRGASVTARRDLAQHLQAIGRSLWREGGLGHLRDVVRREVTQRLALRHPALARRLSGERYDALARLAGVDAADVKAALADDRPPSPQSFTQTMQTLQRLERKI